MSDDSEGKITVDTRNTEAAIGRVRAQLDDLAAKNATVIPDRPVGVPPGATYIPPADDTTRLQEVARHRRMVGERGQLRVHFPFVCFTVHGRMESAHGRVITAHPTRYGQAYAYLFTGDGPVPAVWAWTLADERAGMKPS